MSGLQSLHASDAGVVAVMNTPSSLLRIRINDIPETGLSVSGALQPDVLSLAPGDARFHGALAFTAQINKFGRELSVRGELTGTPVRQCVRCLKDYDAILRLPVTAAYRPDDPPARAAGSVPADVQADDDELYRYEGDWLELAEMLREQIILATPMQPLCKTDCLGLCSVCGVDLNERRCTCPGERPASPFDVLRGLLESPDQPAPPARKPDRMRKPE